MSFPFNDILKLPTRCLLSKRLPKTFFQRNFDLTTSEKKVLNAIISVEWLASIKPTNSNIAAFADATTTFEEIQVITCMLPASDFEKLAGDAATLIQKNIPYHVLAIVESDSEFVVSTTEKRINQNDSSRRTIASSQLSPTVSKLYKTDSSEAFFTGLSFTTLDKTNLQTSYESYAHAIVQLQVAKATGIITRRSRVRSNEDMELLQKLEMLESEVLRLAKQIKKESQFNNRLFLNTEIKKHRDAISDIKKQLTET